MTEVVKFPPLPTVPEPPAGMDDERQRTFVRIVEGLTGQVTEDGVHIRAANLVTGYRASAVDVGRLQELMEEALARFEMNQVRERWSDDVFAWMRRLLLTWIQRCKSIHFDLLDTGIHVQLETQDDRGYYQYEFDVFPGRNHS